jgi:hypothetical protein
MSDTLTRPVLRPATAADIAAFYPGGFPHTMRAWAIEIDGETVGLGGIAYRPAPMGAYLFSDIKPVLRKHPRAMVRAARAFLAEHGDAPVLAFADPNLPGSARFLAFLGFRFFAHGPGADAYQWQPRRGV